MLQHKYRITLSVQVKTFTKEATSFQCELDERADIEYAGPVRRMHLYWVRGVTWHVGCLEFVLIYTAVTHGIQVIVTLCDQEGKSHLRLIPLAVPPQTCEL